MEHERPTLTYDRIVVGETYADREVEATPALCSAYAGAVGALTMPAFLMMASWTIPRVSFAPWQVPPGGIHARQGWTNLRAVVPGERLRVRTSAREKYFVKSRPYVVFESTVEDQSGNAVARGTMTIVWPK